MVPITRFFKACHYLQVTQCVTSFPESKGKIVLRNIRISYHEGSNFFNFFRGFLLQNSSWFVWIPMSKDPGIQTCWMETTYQGRKSPLEPPPGTDSSTLMNWIRPMRPCRPMQRRQMEAKPAVVFEHIKETHNKKGEAFWRGDFTYVLLIEI